MYWLTVVLGLLPLISGFNTIYNDNKIFINCRDQKYMRYNGPQSVLYNGTFTRCENVVDLNISNGSIILLSSNVFQKMTKLKYLDLSKNRIARLSNNLFTSLPKLEKIDLSGNNIMELQENVFSNLPKLKYVYLQENNINDIEKNSFVNVPLLKVINLEFNNLKSLQIDFIDNIHNLNSLVLSENPWICDRNLCNLMQITVNKFWKDIFYLPKCDGIIPWDHMLKYQHIQIDDNVDHRKTEVPDPVEIKCYSCSNATFSWLFEAYNNNWDKRKENITSNATQVINNGYTVSTLTIRGFSDKNVGKYTCYLGNSLTYVDSRSLQLNRIDPTTYPVVGALTGIDPYGYQETKTVTYYIPVKLIIVAVGALISCCCYCLRAVCCACLADEATETEEPLRNEEAA